MEVPVQNVYYLLCYAWNKAPTQGLTDTSQIPNDRVENLLAKVLSEGVSNLIRRGLDRGYRPYVEEERRIRGKLLVSESLKRAVFRRGKAVCQVDDFTHDVPHNRILKAALFELMRLESVDSSLRKRLRGLYWSFEHVSDISLQAVEFRRVQLHRNIRHYSFLMNVCELLGRCLIPTTSPGDREFRPFTASDQEMGHLFEAFVRNFIRREQSIYRVAAPKVPWEAICYGKLEEAWLPEMRTDIVLRSEPHSLLIDTKFYKQPFAMRFGKKTIRSSHLFQILTYLDHLKAQGTMADGLLLYASSEESVPALDYEIQGHRVSTRSLDLQQDWKAIHTDLLEIVKDLGGVFPEAASA